MNDLDEMIVGGRTTRYKGFCFLIRKADLSSSFLPSSSFLTNRKTIQHVQAVHPRIRSSRRCLRRTRTRTGCDSGGTGRRGDTGADRDRQQQPGNRPELQHARRRSSRRRSIRRRSIRRCSSRCRSSRSGTLGTSRLRRGSPGRLRHSCRRTCRLYRPIVNFVSRIKIDHQTALGKNKILPWIIFVGLIIDRWIDRWIENQRSKNVATC